jgi:replicative DNA helicase
VQEVAQFSRGMKILAKELDIPVVALSQLSRKPEDRVDHRPQLADLRESGCLPGEARVWRADTGEQVPIGALAADGETDVPVWSVDADYRLTSARLVRAFPTGRKRVFRLWLRSGRRIDASANHPFLTFDGWTRLDELAVGSRLAVPRRVPEPQSAEPWREDEVVALARRTAETGTPIPEEAFRLKDSQLEQFTARLWVAAGGEWPLGRDGADVTVGSDELARGLQRALTRLGVPARVVRARADGRQRVTVAADDTVPLEAWDEVRRAMAERGMCPAEFSAAMALDVCGTTLWQHPPTREVVARAADVTGSEHLRRLARADLWWDEVIGVEELGVQPVYDATVAGTHSFLADGVVVENSLEQDADIVSFIYRDEVYDPDSPAKGEAELIVAKHRNGPIGTIPLAFLGSTSRFANLRRGGGEAPSGGSNEGSPL